jgi:hypothetical protein
MSRRAASMAAMAKRATNPEEIQAIQQSLVTGVQNGSIQPYIGIPLIQDLTKKLTEAKASMAQNVAGAGMPQPPADGPPIAQQVMQQAAQADQPQGIEALPSNLPQSYAGGGIVAFEEGGQVERYQNQGYTGNQEFGIGDPVHEALDDLKYQEMARLKAIQEAEAKAKFLREAGAPQAAEAEARLAALKGPNPYDPATTTRRSQYTNAPIPAISGAPGAPSAAPRAAIPGGGNFKMPTLTGMTMPPVPTLTDYSTFTAGMPEKTKAATEDAVTKTQKIYEDMDKPGFEAREGRLSQREAAQDKDSAIGRALNLMSLGFGIAGSKERSLAGALGKEGREGIVDLIKGEAANRAAKDRLEDARDNLKQQEVAAKKGNYQAAQTAGQRAADNLYKSQDFAMKAANYGDTANLQRYNIQGDQAFRGASLDQSGKLGIADLELKKRQLNQSAASANAQLQLGREKLDILKGQIAAGDKRAQATLTQAEAKAASTWESSSAYRTAQQQASKMPPIEGQRFIQQKWLEYRGNMLPSLLATEGGGANVPSFSDLYKATE